MISSCNKILLVGTHIAHTYLVPDYAGMFCGLYVAIVHLLILYLVSSFVVSLSQSLVGASPTLLKATTCWPGNLKPFIEACTEIDISKLADNVTCFLEHSPTSCPWRVVHIDVLYLAMHVDRL